MKSLNLSQDHVIKLTLGLVFLLSYSQYFFEINSKVLFIPLSILLVLGYFTLFFSREHKVTKILTKTLAPTNIVFVFALPLIPAITSMFCNTEYPAFYGLTMSLTLIAIRIILSIITIKDILFAYFCASIIFSIIFLTFSAPDLIDSISTTHRFSAFNLHPNLLAFLLVGSIPAQLWAYKLNRNHKRWIPILIIFNIAAVFFSSSRGSLVAFVVGLIGITILTSMKHIKNRKKNNSKKIFWRRLILLYLVTAISFIFILYFDYLKSYTIEVLQLNSQYRGFNSGFSGRIYKWDYTLNALKHGNIFFGNGYRTGDIDLGFSIDNGYLTLIYEVGLIVAIFITVKYLWITICFAKGYFKSQSIQNDALFLSLVFIMIIFLTSNIVARYLFGLGNPFSLLCLFFLVSSRNDINLLLVIPKQNSIRGAFISE